jgi:regulator of cell morphogenesis and NO signaling
MKLHSSQTVGQIAVILKESIPVFNKHKIDYYSEGGRSLENACYLAGASLEQVMRELEEAPPAGEEWYAEEPDWANEPMSELADHIVKTHHAYTRQQFDRIEKMLDELIGKGGFPHTDLETVRYLFRHMSADQRDHMLEEEEVVFPYLAEVERDLQRGRPIPHPFQGYSPSTHPLRVLMSDHGMMGREWRKIEDLTHEFTPPAGAGPELQELYKAIRELEKDNQKHIHLENNILFHRAEQLGLLSDEAPEESHLSKF